MYYIVELEIEVGLKKLLDDAAERENLTLEAFIIRTLTDFLSDADKVRKLKDKYDALPDNEKGDPDNIKVIRIFPVHEGETEAEARAKTILEESGNNTMKG